MTYFLIILIIFTIYFLKKLFFSAGDNQTIEIDPYKGDKKDSKMGEEETIVITDYTPRTLYKYNGHDDEKVYLSIKGKIFDVSKGRAFYGPGGPYENFAGRDASRGLAKNSFKEDMVRDWDQPIDKLEDLTEREKKALDEWEAFFEKKYNYIGNLIEDTSLSH
ncbi:cytochrome b5-like heme/steroid binding domain-containing protein [Ascoidea rubescens DSM 1968]|uniref:Cytochrome b5 n=1 Tax=Ascoidea rubescens DSM 1968 TaxID=1344418 RepID=A0A1D2VE12_9ASCO|nr:cytochrome b5 [Ascoidea rubescens DSM 1968]ODV59839.1 cytochrome b5 [Ascoidea rubescens DSM 1968]